MADAGLRVALERPFPSPHGEDELLALARGAAEAPGDRSVHHGTLVSGERVVVKVGRRGPRRRALDRLTGRPTRSENAARMALLLHGADVPTPEVYACVVARSPGGVTRWDATVTRALDAVTLTEALRANPARAAELLPACGQLVARMHGAGVFHGDLKGSNLLVSGELVLLVDLEGCRQRSPLGLRLRARDVGRLIVTLDVLGIDGAPLLEAYAAAAGLADSSAITAGVSRYARRKRRQNARRGRPLT